MNHPHTEPSTLSMNHSKEIEFWKKANTERCILEILKYPFVFFDFSLPARHLMGCQTWHAVEFTKRFALNIPRYAPQIRTVDGSELNCKPALEHRLSAGERSWTTLFTRALCIALDFWLSNVLHRDAPLYRLGRDQLSHLAPFLKWL